MYALETAFPPRPVLTWRGARPADVHARLKEIAERWAATLANCDKIEQIPFNEMTPLG